MITATFSELLGLRLHFADEVSASNLNSELTIGDAVTVLYSVNSVFLIGMVNRDASAFLA